jgi:hypothetical protein
LPIGGLLPQRGAESLEDYISNRLVPALTETLSDLFQPGAFSSLQIASSQVTGVQAHSALLDAIAALSSTGLIVRTGSGTAAARTIVAGTGVTVTNGDGVSGNVSIAVSGGGVTTFNTRTGDVVLTGADVTAAIPFDLVLSQQVI